MIQKIVLIASKKKNHVFQKNVCAIFQKYLYNVQKVSVI